MKWMTLWILLFSQLVLATVSMQAGIDYRYKRQPNQFDQFENYLSIGMGYALNPYLSFSGELVYGESPHSSGNFSVIEKEYNFLGWAQLAFPKMLVFRPAMGVGLGVAQYDLDTRFGSSSNRTRGDFLPVMGVEFSTRVDFQDLIDSPASGFFNLSLRGLGGADYRPSPIWSMQAMFGMYL